MPTPNASQSDDESIHRSRYSARSSMPTQSPKAGPSRMYLIRTSNVNRETAAQTCLHGEPAMQNSPVALATGLFFNFLV